MTIQYNRKSVINFNFSLVFVSKIKLNFCYKKMIEKMYDNLQEKYKNSVFQILKICKQLFGNKVIERFSLTSQIEHPN